MTKAEQMNTQQPIVTDKVEETASASLSHSALPTIDDAETFSKINHPILSWITERFQRSTNQEEPTNPQQRTPPTPPRPPINLDDPNASLEPVSGDQRPGDSGIVTPEGTIQIIVPDNE